VKEEQAESESRKASGKVWGQNGWKEGVPDTNGMLERKEKEHGEEVAREVLPEERVCQWRNGKIQSKRKMDDVGLSERDKDTNKQERRERIK
jgi:hypothetical protein